MKRRRKIAATARRQYLQRRHCQRISPRASKACAIFAIRSTKATTH